MDLIQSPSFRKAVPGSWEQQMGLLPLSGWCDAHVPRRAEHPQELLGPAGAPCCPPTLTQGWLFSADQIDVFCVFLANHKICFKAAQGP